MSWMKKINKRRQMITWLAQKLCSTRQSWFEKSHGTAVVVKPKNVFLWRVDSFSEILRKAKRGKKQRTERDSFNTKIDTESFRQTGCLLMFSFSWLTKVSGWDNFKLWTAPISRVMTLNQKKTKSHHQRLLPDELLIL